jgi:hypothetical protein
MDRSLSARQSARTTTYEHPPGRRHRVLSDTAAHLPAPASLITQAERLPQAVHAACKQKLTRAEIGQLLNLTPSTAARRYRNA